MAILKEHKSQLGELHAKGHAKFGKVAPRRPYRDEDEGGDGAGLKIETHPLLANLPAGDSNLTPIANQNSEAQDEALKRAEELTYTLRNQPALQAQLNNTPHYTPKPIR